MEALSCSANAKLNWLAPDPFVGSRFSGQVVRVGMSGETFKCVIYFHALIQEMCQFNHGAWTNAFDNASSSEKKLERQYLGTLTHRITGVLFNITSHVAPVL